MCECHDRLGQDGGVPAAHPGAPAVPAQGPGLHPRAGGHPDPGAGHPDIRGNAEASAVLHHHRLPDLRRQEGHQAAGDRAQKQTGCGAFYQRNSF